jgi:hypothetical protein
VKRTGLLASIFAAVSVAVAACSDTTAGIPGAQGNGSVTASNTPGGGPFSTGQSTASTVPSGSKGDSRLANVAPCGLLTDAENAQLRAGAGKEDIISDSRACAFEHGDGFAMTISIYPSLGIGDVVSKGAVQPGNLNKHQIVQYLGGISSCGIAIKVSETSRVDVSSSARGDEQKACQIARQGAEYVEQKLP